MEAYKIAIIDDHEVVINGLKAMLGSEQGVEIILCTSAPAELLQQITAHPVDVLLMDIQMPEISGVDLCRQVLKIKPGLKIIAFSSFDDSHYIRQVIRNGASGYILKNADKNTILTAIDSVMDEKEFLDESIKNILLQESLTGHKRSIYDIPLTKREQEILKLVAEGHSNQQIADLLFISQRTVETHRLNLTQKLGVKNTVALVKEAIRRGMIE